MESAAESFVKHKRIFLTDLGPFMTLDLANLMGPGTRRWMAGTEPDSATLIFMLLDELFKHDYAILDGTEENSHKKEVSDKMIEKALEVRAAELELEEAKANLEEAKEAVETSTEKTFEALREERKTATSIVIKAKKTNPHRAVAIPEDAWKKT